MARPSVVLFALLTLVCIGRFGECIDNYKGILVTGKTPGQLLHTASTDQCGSMLNEALKKEPCSDATTVALVDVRSALELLQHCKANCSKSTIVAALSGQDYSLKSESDSHLLKFWQLLVVTLTGYLYQYVNVLTIRGNVQAVESQQLDLEASRHGYKSFQELLKEGEAMETFLEKREAIFDILQACALKKQNGGWTRSKSNKSDKLAEIMSRSDEQFHQATRDMDVIKQKGSRNRVTLAYEGYDAETMTPKMYQWLDDMKLLLQECPKNTQAYVGLGRPETRAENPIDLLERIVKRLGRVSDGKEVDWRRLGNKRTADAWLPGVGTVDRESFRAALLTLIASILWYVTKWMKLIFYRPVMPVTAVCMGTDGNGLDYARIVNLQCLYRQDQADGLGTLYMTCPKDTDCTYHAELPESTCPWDMEGSSTKDCPDGAQYKDKVTISNVLGVRWPYHEFKFAIDKLFDPENWVRTYSKRATMISR